MYEEVELDGKRFMVDDEFMQCECCNTTFTMEFVDFNDGKGNRIVMHKTTFTPAFCPRCGAPQPADIQALAELGDGCERRFRRVMRVEKEDVLAGRERREEAPLRDEDTPW